MITTLMQVATIVGILVLGGIAFVVIALLWAIAGNIYGGIKGAYRIREIHIRHGNRAIKHRYAIKRGFSNWLGGGRYNGHSGSYYDLGSMQVPVDGRDPIIRRHYG